jgi:hypothetical protein
MQQIIYDILAYLSENPAAQDTSEGIVEWWLSRQTVKPPAFLVGEALTELVDRELILARRCKAERTYYKVNRRKLKEISAMLAQVRGADAPND